jgi:hypothetical protein
MRACGGRINTFSTAAAQHLLHHSTGQHGRAYSKIGDWAPNDIRVLRNTGMTAAALEKSHLMDE